jgi:hypothetical protein
VVQLYSIPGHTTKNALLKEGQWKNCYVGGMTVGKLHAAVVETFEMEEDVADHLLSRYETHVGTADNTQKKWLDEGDALIEEVEYRPSGNIKDAAHLGIDCLEIQALMHHEAGEMVEEDVNCDSQFMLENIRKVGKAMREKLYWVPRPHKCYLVMDNAGGHGTEEVIKKYTDILKTKFHIEIIHQVPCSPKTKNVLDLGIWCSLQLAVDMLMQGKQGDMEALVQGVAAVWDECGTHRCFWQCLESSRKGLTSY